MDAFSIIGYTVFGIAGLAIVVFLILDAIDSFINRDLKGLK